MAPEKKDRRTRRTRQLLRSALLALLKEKRYEEISVQDIIERADVARSTFYMHYLDKDDLLTGGHGVFAENLGQQLTSHAGENRTSVLSSRAWFYHIQAQVPILKVIAKDPAMDLAMKTLRGIIRRSVEEGMHTHSLIENTSVPLSLVVDYLTDTLMTLIKWWFKDGMKYTPEQMDEMFQQLVMPGVSSMLKAGAARHETR
ncbi:MAG TPA: TetR/AcrR family transcriptional regulator [Anaerolineales bacterium]|nr:TetR/AcrR family transcriptional regulator [Anaerolineales bacterium]